MKSEHYTKSAWPPRVTYELGSHNVFPEPFVKKEYVILLPLYIKLGIMKQFVKALEYHKPAFQCLNKHVS